MSNSLPKYYLFYPKYLNQKYEGGETRIFPDSAKKEDFIDIKGEEGSCLIFRHRVYHSGLVVNSGIKYVLRSDIFVEK